MIWDFSSSFVGYLVLSLSVAAEVVSESFLCCYIFWSEDKIMGSLPDPV